MSERKKTTQVQSQGHDAWIHGSLSIDGWMDGARICVAGISLSFFKSGRVDNTNQKQPGGRKEGSKLVEEKNEKNEESQGSQ